MSNAKNNQANATTEGTETMTTTKQLRDRIQNADNDAEKRIARHDLRDHIRANMEAKRIAGTIDRLRGANQTLAIACASPELFDIDAITAKIDSLEAELAGEPDTGPAQHLTYSTDTETFTICGGRHPRLS